MNFGKRINAVPNQKWCQQALVASGDIIANLVKIFVYMKIIYESIYRFADICKAHDID